MTDYKHFSPYIRVAMYDILTDKFCFDRVIWDYEIIYLSEGKMKLTIEDKIFNCIEGDIIFLRPRIHHILESQSDKVVQPHVHFDFFEDENSPKIFVPFVRENKMTSIQKTWFRKDFLSKIGVNLPPLIRLNNSYAIKDILLRLIDEFTYKYPYSEYMEQALLIELFTEIVRSYNEQHSNATVGHHAADLNNLIKYINTHIDENISLDDLAYVSNISKWHLSRIFKETFGVSPYKYVNSLKIKRAKELIQYSDFSMKSISYQMNFESQQAFSRWFKKIDGKSPIDYRINKNFKQ